MDFEATTENNCVICGKTGTLQGAGATARSKPWFCNDHKQNYRDHNQGMR